MDSAITSLLNQSQNASAGASKRTILTTEAVSEIISENSVVLFARGNRLEPRCGFTARAIDFLDASGIEFLCLDVLADRSIIPAVTALFGRSNFPSVCIDNELIDDFDRLRVVAQRKVANG